MRCPHVEADWLARYPPLPCELCGGWVDRDRTVMDRKATVARYPMIASYIASGQPCPDTIHRAMNPTGGDKALRLVALSGKLASTLLLALFAALALALIVVVLVKLA